MGYRHSEETKAKISRSLMGHPGAKRSPEGAERVRKLMMGNKHSLGYHHTQESRAAISKAHKGRVLSNAHCIKISISKIGNTAMLGKKHSPEARSRMSRAQKKVWASLNRKIAIPRSAETCRKISISNTGKKRSAEVRAKLSAIGKARGSGWSLSPETKAKMSATRIRMIQEGTIRVGGWSKSGKFYSNKNGRLLGYRSLLELEWYKLLELLPEVLRYFVETITIPYIWEGVSRLYTPDLKIKYTDGSRRVVEIKPEGVWARTPKEQAKWAAARVWCDSKHIDFQVWGYRRLKRVSARYLNIQRPSESNLVCSLAGAIPPRAVRVGDNAHGRP